LDMFDTSSEMMDPSPLLSDPYALGQFETNGITDDLSAAYMNNSTLPDEFASLFAEVQNGSSDVSEFLSFGDGLDGSNDCMSALDSWVNGNVY